MMAPGATAGVVTALGEKYPVLGLALTHHRTTRNQPLSFHDKPYLIELYCDAHKIEGFDAMKAVQVGWSELLVQLMLERAGWAGRMASYVLPSYQLRDRFVKNRINPLLERVPAYAGKVDPMDPGSLKTKRFGDGVLLFLGSNTVNDFIEFSTDVLIVDEFDRCVGENLALARDRLRASPYPQLFRIGNPTYPQQGIAGLYGHSDGRKWHHQCGRCNERQPLEWAVNIVHRDTSGRWIPKDKANAETGTLRPVCRKCHKPFDRTAKGGEWVAERPLNPRRGYHISRLDVLSQDLRQLLHEWGEAQGNDTKLEAFYRSVLGRPHEKKGSSVDREMLANATIGNPMDEAGGSKYQGKTILAGIDVGSLLNINISEMIYDEEHERKVRRGIWAGTVTSFSEAYDVLMRYRVQCAVIDARPEVRKAQELRDRCNREGTCDLWLCQFSPGERIGREAYAIKRDYGRHVVTVDRTQLLDATLEDIRTNPPSKTFPEDIWRVKDWADQMVAPKRRLSDKTNRFIWEEGSADDHYRFADAYERVAADIIGKSGEYYG